MKLYKGYRGDIEDNIGDKATDERELSWLC